MADLLTGEARFVHARDVSPWPGHVQPEQRAEVEGLLGAMRGSTREADETEEGAAVFVLTPPESQLHKDWDNTIIGRIVVGSGWLRLETNSLLRFPPSPA